MSNFYFGKSSTHGVNHMLLSEPALSHDMSWSQIKGTALGVYFFGRGASLCCLVTQYLMCEPQKLKFKGGGKCSSQRNSNPPLSQPVTWDDDDGLWAECMTRKKNTWKRWKCCFLGHWLFTRVRHILWQNDNTLPCQGRSGDGWSVETQGVGSQPVFDIIVQPVVQRPGSADGNHRRRRSAVHSGCQNIQPCAAAPPPPLSSQAHGGDPDQGIR